LKVEQELAFALWLNWLKIVNLDMDFKIEHDLILLAHSRERERESVFAVP
jgi:hypothetical protein